MEQPHFVRDYRALVAGTLASHPYDEAMQLAVGGEFEAIGRQELAVLLAAGLQNGQAIIDVGCGSGRAATQLGRHFQRLRYLGIDVVPELLEYAAKVSPRSYRFEVAPGLSIPAPDASADMICFFSVFTHLKHEESYRYLRDARRALKPGGRIVFSFLESAKNWNVFIEMVEAATVPHHNQLIERSMIEAWARGLGLKSMGYDWPELGQSVAVLAG